MLQYLVNFVVIYRLSGAVLGITCLLLSFIVEAIFVCAATLLVMFKVSIFYLSICILSGFQPNLSVLMSS